MSGLLFRRTTVVLLLVTASAVVSRAADFQFKNVTITVPDGFMVEVAAEAPIVGYPMMACFDERGRMFVAEAGGTNGVIEVLEQITPNFIRMIEDTDGDGKFDKSTIFADKLQIPNGALWHEGSLYVAEPPGIWRYTDTDNDGVADKREHIAGRVASNGMSSSLHGPVLGPTGHLFWCGGQGGYVLDKDQPLPKGRIAPGVFVMKKDGSEHEQWSIGGMANPVEVAFNDEGEVFGTVAILDRKDGARHDSLMHWVYGGIYDGNPNDPVPLKRTGPRLPPLSRVGQVAPSGVMRYRSTQFGEAYTGNIFWAQFNTQKIIRTQIKRQGATFQSTDEDFLVGDNVDFHVTDIFEDADGSLLVIDTGGWFRHGCPTSQIAKPEVKGAIYRIRRTDAKPVADPRGKQIDWTKTGEVVSLLGDSRIAVEDRAIATLAAQGEKAVRALEGVIKKSATVQERRNAVWTLSRMDTKPARAAIRIALADADSSVRQAAVHSAGMIRDADAMSQLMKLVEKDPEPSVRREAAMALGRIGDSKTVGALLAALQGQKDPFIQHAIIYALIQINDPAATTKGLVEGQPLVRRGALLALNQMDNAQVTREQIAPLLRAKDLELQKAAFSIAARNTNWTEEVASALRENFGEAAPTEERLAFLGEILSSQVTNPPVQNLLAETLSRGDIAKPTRLVILETIKGANVKVFPKAWNAALERELTRGDIDTRLAAVGVVQERTLKGLDAVIRKIASDEREPKELRIAFLSTIARRLSPVDESLFSLLCSELKPESSPFNRLTAARALAALSLSEDQLKRLAELLAQIDSLALPTVLRSFGSNTNEPVGMALVAGLDKAPAAANLSIDEVARIINKFPEAVRSAAKPLLQKLGAELEKQQAHIESLLPVLEGGDFSRGKAVFFGKKSACSACHRVSGQGGVVGPNLSKIATIRTGRDLLESTIYPSASIVQGYHPYTIETDDDQVYSGVIVRETPEAVWIRGTDLVENKVEQKRITVMRESALSIMPQGLGDILSTEELRDLMAFLLQLK